MKHSPDEIARTPSQIGAALRRRRRALGLRQADPTQQCDGGSGLPGPGGE